MGVYIKGFPLPNNCGACPLRLAWCRERIYMVTRPERCPLVPVPPHGRLIDADALNEAMARMVPWAIADPTANAFLDGLSAAYEVIQSAPTIIPAEEGEA